MKMKDVTTILAEELHRNYRAAEKALNRTKVIWRKGKPRRNKNLLLHDHGFLSCGKRSYFVKRAELLIKRSKVKNPETLGQAEEALAAAILKRRLIVGGLAE